jgi:hypothetical protein
MATIDTLTASIIDDMAKGGESGITAAVSNAIDLSIAHYESIPWWFMEVQDTDTTVDGTEYYDLPSNMASTEITLTIEVSNNTYPLIKRHFQLLEDYFVKSNIFKGYPTDYAIWKQQIRLYPVPNGAYTLTRNYYQKLGAPTAGNSNNWTTDGEMLIRARSEWQLHSLRYHDLEAADGCKGSGDGCAWIT